MTIPQGIPRTSPRSGHIRVDWTILTPHSLHLQRTLRAYCIHFLHLDWPSGGRPSFSMRGSHDPDLSSSSKASAIDNSTSTTTTTTTSTSLRRRQQMYWCVGGQGDDLLHTVTYVAKRSRSPTVDEDADADGHDDAEDEDEDDDDDDDHDDDDANTDDEDGQAMMTARMVVRRSRCMKEGERRTRTGVSSSAKTSPHTSFHEYCPRLRMIMIMIMIILRTRYAVSGTDTYHPARSGWLCRVRY
eukprot:1890875-Rhodomonas_salina.2